MCRLIPVLLLALSAPALAASRGPATRPTTQPVPPPPEVVALVERVGTAYARLTSLELAGTVTLSLREDGQARTHAAPLVAAYLAPARYRHEVAGQPLLGATGLTAFVFDPGNNTYSLTEVPEATGLLARLPAPQQATLLWENPALALALAQDRLALLRTQTKRFLGVADEAIAGTDCTVLKLELTDGGSPAEYSFDKATGLLRRMTVDLTSFAKSAGRSDLTEVRYVVDYTTVNPDVAIPAERFAWAPPADSRRASVLDSARPAAPLGGGGLLMGRAAPDFALDDLAGHKVSLADLKGSIVILDFWATWCGPCRAAMPHLNALYAKYKDRGLVVYAVNLQETRDQAAKYMADNKLALPVLLDTTGNVAKQYGVSGIPTTILIDAEGKVRWVGVGFGGNLDDLEKQVKDQR
jgi:thiol-disulfide isomerase/thioredoxin